MVERYRANTENPELDWETQVIFDDVVKREYEKLSELNSRRKKLIFIQETFGWWGPMEIGQLLGTDEKTSKRFLSRRGVRDEEYEKIKNRFDGAFAAASIILDESDDVVTRRSMLSAIQPNSKGTTIKLELIKGNPEKAVLMVEASFRHLHDE